MKEKITIRVIHRYLGFFMAGIMTIYGFSGIILLNRDTHKFKIDKEVKKELPAHLSELELSAISRIKGFKITENDGQVITFGKGPYNTEGTYNIETGEIQYIQKIYPPFIDRLVKFHKKTSKSDYSYLNIFFGLTLIFFVISSFFMFRWDSPIFKKGLLFTLAGLLFAIALVFL